MDYQVACPNCRANIGVMAPQIGTQMRCPHCKKLFLVGNPTERDPSMPLGRLFSFRCAQCHSRLEAYTSMSGQQAQCPTCGAEFTVPAAETQAAPERTGGTEPESEYAQPVHAYAAAGDKAPQIVHLDNGDRAIKCPRCGHVNPVTADNCARCAAPFTLEAAERPAKSSGGGFGTAALVLGIIGIPAFCTFVPSVLAIIFGVLALRAPVGAVGSSQRGQGIAGLVLGSLGLLFFAVRILA